ncbi:MAG: LEA type 2 family protein [Planctomycetes bacterium]|nr:LEA type 2 family protein [Planctomycetota bacterium]
MPATIPVVDPDRRRGSPLGRLALALALALPGGCALFRPAEPVSLRLGLLETRIEAEAFGEVKLQGLFSVENDNDFEVVLAETERSLRIEERHLRSEVDQVHRTVAPAGRLEIPVTMTIDCDRLRAELPRTPTTGQVQATLQLAVRCDRRELFALGFVTAEWSGALPLLERPRLGFRDFTVTALSPLQTDYRLVLDLRNPNLYPLRLRGLDLDIVIEGQSFGQVEADDLDQEIPSGEVVTVRIDRSQRLTGEDSRLFSLLQPGRKIAIAVAGEARFGFDSPLSPLPARIAASGQVER